MDCFYACERLRHPDLNSEPVVIGMGYEQADPHGAVATASYEAREYGVESAMAISEALDRLPRMTDADFDDEAAPEPGWRCCCEFLPILRYMYGDRQARPGN